MLVRSPVYFFFFFNDTATTEIYTLSLHDALPISIFFLDLGLVVRVLPNWGYRRCVRLRSEEHTSELQSQSNLVCRLLLEKKKQMSNQAPLGFQVCLQVAKAA